MNLRGRKGGERMKKERKERKEGRPRKGKRIKCTPDVSFYLSSRAWRGGRDGGSRNH